MQAARTPRQVSAEEALPAPQSHVGCVWRPSRRRCVARLSTSQLRLLARFAQPVAAVCMRTRWAHVDLSCLSGAPR